MPRVSVKVELAIDVEPGENPAEIEARIASEGRRAARDPYMAVLQQLDEAATKASGGAKQRLEPRWISTTVGRLRIHRYRVKGPDGTFHPLDKAMGFAQSEPSPALREMLCDLGIRIPFRQVAAFVDYWIEGMQGPAVIQAIRSIAPSCKPHCL